MTKWECGGWGGEAVKSLGHLGAGGWGRQEADWQSLEMKGGEARHADTPPPAAKEKIPQHRNKTRIQGVLFPMILVWGLSPSLGGNTWPWEFVFLS